MKNIKRTCYKCKKELAIDRFYSGYICKSCDNAKGKEYRDSHREENSKQQKDYRARIHEENKMASTTVLERTCNKCEETLPIENFSKDASRKGGFQYCCKACDTKKGAQHRLDNLDAYRKRKREEQKIRRDKDNNFRLRGNLSARISNTLRGKNKSESTLSLLGCSLTNLRKYLEEQFTDSMTWDNYGLYWEIDHIRPCASFDLTKEAAQKECFHYMNLQPLTIRDNRSKGAN